MLLNCGVGENSLRVPWTAKRSNQSILKEISPEYSMEGLMLKLKIRTFGHLMQRTNSLEKTLMLRKTEGRRREDRGWDGWMASPTPWTWVWASSGVIGGQGSLACCNPWGRKELDTTEQLNWRQFTDVPTCTVMSHWCPSTFMGSLQGTKRSCTASKRNHLV